MPSLLRVQRDEADVRRERAGDRGPEALAARRRAGSSRENRPGTRPVPSAPTTPTWASTSGWTLSCVTVGEPSVTMPATRSGRRAASARANMPPRLWPMIATRSPVALGEAPRAAPPAARRPPRSSRRWRGCRRGACGSRSRAASCVIVASEPSPAMKPGISSTGRPSPAGTPRAAPDRAAQQRRGLEAQRDSRARAAGCAGCGTSHADRRYLPHQTSARTASSIDPAGRSDGYASRIASRRCAPPPSATADRGRASTPTPSPRTGELLVRVRAAGPQRRRHAAARGPLPGAARRPAGHPRARAGGRGRRRAGAGVERFEPGDRVMAIVAGGGQAELAVVHERTAMPVPEELDWDGGGRRARGLHHRPRRALHPGRADASASGCSSTARPAASAWPPCSSAQMAGARVTATVRNEQPRDADRRARRQRDRARGLRRARPVRRHPRARRRARTCPGNLDALATARADLRDRRRRRRARPRSTCAR